MKNLKKHENNEKCSTNKKSCNGKILIGIILLAGLIFSAHHIFAGKSNASEINSSNSMSNSQDLSEVVAKQEIMETIYKYSYTWDNKNPDELSKLFTENAVWEWYSVGAKEPKVSLKNSNELKEFASERFKTNLADRQTRHYQTNIVFIELTEDYASTQTMILLIHKIEGEGQPKVMGSGIYKDEFIKTREGWKISHRSLFVD